MFVCGMVFISSNNTNYSNTRELRYYPNTVDYVQIIQITAIPENQIDYVSPYRYVQIIQITAIPENLSLRS